MRPDEVSDACSQKCYLDKWSLSAQIRIVNTPRTIVFPAPPPRLPDINVYVTDSGTSQGCLTLKKTITFIYVEKDNVPSLQALSRSPEQTLDLANNLWFKKKKKRVEESSQ